MPFFDLHNLQQVFFIVTLQHNLDYVLVAFFGGYFIVLSAYFPYGGGVLCLWK